jgi:hypothetical protein
MTERHPPVREPQLKAVTVRHPSEGGAVGCSVGAAIEPRCANGSPRPEGD